VFTLRDLTHQPAAGLGRVRRISRISDYAAGAVIPSRAGLSCKEWGRVIDRLG
jgi:hypothetical protein